MSGHHEYAGMGHAEDNNNVRPVDHSSYVTSAKSDDFFCSICWKLVDGPSLWIPTAKWKRRMLVKHVVACDNSIKREILKGMLRYRRICKSHAPCYEALVENERASSMEMERSASLCNEEFVPSEKQRNYHCFICEKRTCEPTVQIPVGFQKRIVFVNYLLDANREIKDSILHERRWSRRRVCKSHAPGYETLGSAPTTASHSVLQSPMRGIAAHSVNWEEHPKMAEENVPTPSNREYVCMTVPVAVDKEAVSCSQRKLPADSSPGYRLLRVRMPMDRPIYQIHAPSRVPTFSEDVPTKTALQRLSGESEPHEDVCPVKILKTDADKETYEVAPWNPHPGGTLDGYPGGNPCPGGALAGPPPQEPRDTPNGQDLTLGEVESAIKQEIMDDTYEAVAESEVNQRAVIKLEVKQELREEAGSEELPVRCGQALHGDVLSSQESVLQRLKDDNDNLIKDDGQNSVEEAQLKNVSVFEMFDGRLTTRSFKVHKSEIAKYGACAVIKQMYKCPYVQCAIEPEHNSLHTFCLHLLFVHNKPAHIVDRRFGSQIEFFEWAYRFQECGDYQCVLVEEDESPHLRKKWFQCIYTKPPVENFNGLYKESPLIGELPRTTSRFLPRGHVCPSFYSQRVLANGEVHVRYCSFHLHEVISPAVPSFIRERTRRLYVMGIQEYFIPLLLDPLNCGMPSSWICARVSELKQADIRAMFAFLKENPRYRDDFLCEDSFDGLHLPKLREKNCGQVDGFGMSMVDKMVPGGKVVPRETEHATTCSVNCEGGIQHRVSVVGRNVVAPVPPALRLESTRMSPKIDGEFAKLNILMMRFKNRLVFRFKEFYVEKYVKGLCDFNGIREFVEKIRKMADYVAFEDYQLTHYLMDRLKAATNTVEGKKSGRKRPDPFLVWLATSGITEPVESKRSKE